MGTVGNGTLTLKNNPKPFFNCPQAQDIAVVHKLKMIFLLCPWNDRHSNTNRNEQRIKAQRLDFLLNNFKFERFRLQKCVWFEKREFLWSASVNWLLKPCSCRSSYTGWNYEHITSVWMIPLMLSLEEKSWEYFTLRIFQEIIFFSPDFYF